eukprot:2255084-Prymnesium_polylepis.1
MAQRGERAPCESHARHGIRRPETEPRRTTCSAERRVRQPSSRCDVECCGCQWQCRRPAVEA